MCGETMNFPKEWQDFIDLYSFKDKEEVYTNGRDLISVYRVRQMIEHYFSPKKKESGYGTEYEAQKIANFLDFREGGKRSVYRSEDGRWHIHCISNRV